MIEILDKRLKKVDILRKYTFAQYSMKFRDIGTFTIDARITEENLFLLNEEEEYSILFDGNIFGKVLKITRESDSENEKVIKIQGLLSNRFFDQRVIKLKTFNDKTYKNIYNLMKEYAQDYEETGWLDIEVKYEDEQRLERVCTKSKKQQTGGTYWECIKDFLDQDYLGIYFNPIVKPEHEHQLGIYDPFMTNISKWELIISAGVDRTKRNTDGNIPVIFSQSLSNIKDTSLELNRESYKNIAYVAGEGEGEDRTWIQVRTKNITTDEQIFPWSVNEMYVDARDIQGTKQDGTQMSNEEYTKLLEERAEEKFSENNKTKIYSATIIQANKQYTYLKDYKLGDWITIQDKELSIEVDAQITEITKSITGMSEIIDLEVTYGQIRKEPVEQMKGLVNKTNKQNNDIKYLENKTKQFERVGKFYKVYGTATAKYQDTVYPCKLSLPKGLYLVLASADLSIGGQSGQIMNISLVNNSKDTLKIISGNNGVRTIALYGGGCMMYNIIECTGEGRSEIALGCYGYMNADYYFRGNICAIVIQ